MIKQLSVRNFQSLREVDIELGGFTVIVGPSSSGKSAILRAARALVSNAKGASFITTGATQTRIAVVLDDGIEVELMRGKENSYAIGEYLQEDREPGAVLSFTKLAGAVPPEVSNVLRMQPVKASSINFAGQFDRPYLLDDSGAEVARTLGELTNVTILFEAAREANRMRLAHGNNLKVREADLAALLVKADKFRTLPARIGAVGEAEVAAERANTIYRERQELVDQLTRLGVAEAALAQARAALAVIPTGVDIPVDDIDERQRAYRELYDLTVSFDAARSAWRDTTELLPQLDSTITIANREFSDYLRLLGRCPTCGAESEHMHPEAVA